MNQFKAVFSIDLRSMAIFRIGMGLILIWDLILRSLYLRDHYSDLGVLPRGILIDKFMSDWTFSIHLMNGQTYFQLILFIIAFICDLLLILGYRTKLMTIISWFLLVSLQNRNYMVLQGGDTVLRVMLFWSMFLPLGAQYSLDRAFSNFKEKNQMYFSVATIGMIIQIMVIYIFNALTKTHPNWTEDYNALWFALQIDQFILPLGKVIREYPQLCKVLTFATHKFELFVPFLLLIPFKNYLIRILIIFSFIGFHIGIASTMNVGLFPFICILMWPIMLPKEFWEYFSFHKKDPITFYYDQDCGFCKKMVLAIQVFMFEEKSKVKTLQSNPTTKNILKNKNTWVVETHDGKQLQQFDALRYLFNKAKIFKLLAIIFSPKSMQNLGNKIYQLVAKNRKFMGKLSAFFKYGEYEIKPNKYLNLLAGFFIISILLHNYSTLKSNDYELPALFKNTNLILRISQNWKMFAPKPLRNDGWFAIDGELKNGKKVELFFDNKNQWSKPDDVEAMYPTQRWRKYMMNIASKKYKKQRLYFGKWVCRIWNREHKDDEQLDNFQIYFMLEQTKLDLSEMEVRKNKIWNHNCFAK